MKKKLNKKTIVLRVIPILILVGCLFFVSTSKVEAIIQNAIILNPQTQSSIIKSKATFYYPLSITFFEPDSDVYKINTLYFGLVVEGQTTTKELDVSIKGLYEGAPVNVKFVEDVAGTFNPTTGAVTMTSVRTTPGGIHTTFPVVICWGHTLGGEHETTSGVLNTYGLYRNRIMATTTGVDPANSSQVMLAGDYTGSVKVEVLIG